MHLMALDVGERRIGIAVSESGILATPHSVLHRKSKKEDFARLQRLIEEQKIERVIVGLPYSLSGVDRMGPQARRIKRYAEALAQTIDVPLEYFDESYSTVDAEAYLTPPSLEGAPSPGGGASGERRASSEGHRRKPGRRRRGKAPLDAAAAAVILQNYLDSRDDG
jgi:putative Holliday junction resolvase